MFSGSGFPRWDRKTAERSSGSSYEIPFFLNAAYYPNWRIYRKQPPSSLRLGFISHIFYAFAWYILVMHHHHLGSWQGCVEPAYPQL
jgi:chitinase